MRHRVSLIAGFGSVPILTAALVMGGQWNQHRTRTQLVATLDAAGQRVKLAKAVHISLLECAVAVRSMALQADVNGIRRKWGEAEIHQHAFSALTALKESGLSDDSNRHRRSLGALNKQVQADFTEVGDLHPSSIPTRWDEMPVVRA